MHTEIKSNIFTEVAWIPVIDLSGNKKTVHLRDFLINCENYVDYNLDSIPNRISLQHFMNFTAISYARKFKKIDDDPKVFFKNLVPYLDQYEKHFQLAGPDHFFLQQPDHKKLGEKDFNSIATLLLEMESGNNGSHFTKNSDLYPKNLNVSEVLFALLQGHLFGFGGLGGGLKGEKNNYVDSIATRPLSVFFVMSNLQKTIYSNAAYYFECTESYRSNMEGEENKFSIPPIWECSDHGLSQIEKYKNFLDSHSTCEKFGFERIFQLEWDYSGAQPTVMRIKRAQGIFKSENIDTLYPFLIYAENKKKQEIYNLKADQNKAVWRDLHNILHWFTLNKSSPDCIEEKIKLEVLGIYSDQAKAFGSMRSHFEFSKKLLETEKKQDLESYIEKIHNIEFGLKSSFKEAFSEVFSKDDFFNLLNHSEALNVYWNRMGSYFLHNLIFKISENYNEEYLKKEFNSEVYKACDKAKEKFIQSISDGVLKYKLLGLLYKGHKNEHKITQ
ncbi:type I-E CRISPR-associated protein Cse1/CasA [Fluviispira multicolorata]|uniref:Type I-E CRISPR-associated protein Cse1/CasA n=1 Tax=Fluviispira multicolorata TaxID=2654512 RepID=A0A833N7K4_9BACT|nr:type I-E CRISPR-associated protein Cse1/CasA [Fluviispira multicolorata]KAB8032260.1 type I-E CRISPR-associated protein Cse1/CasA [Fluviispira multicolorata]